MTAVDRILEILKDTGLSARQFEISIGKTSGYLNSLVKRGSSPSINVISKIIEVYPQYNGEWIISGRGSMIHKEKDNPLNTSEITIEALLDEKINSKFVQLKEELIYIIRKQQA